MAPDTMRLRWIPIVAVLTWIAGLAVVPKAEPASGKVAGILDGGGGGSRSESYVLSAGSLGQPHGTGELSSSRYELVAGFLGRVTSSPVRLTGDFNGDRAVDFIDFLLFAGSFGRSRGEEGYEARFDLDGNGRIAFSDFLSFAAAYGKQG